MSAFKRTPFKKTKYKSISKSTNTSTSNNGYLKGDTDFLLIVESPSKCKKIEEYLGPSYKCIASNGHIRNIDGLNAIDTKNTFEPTFKWIDEKKQHIEKMSQIIDEFPKTNIILATDDDREGEAIAWHICQVFGLNIETSPRIIFHEITKPAITKSIENPSRINMDLVRAQHARQVLDIIVGYKVSPFLWKGIIKENNEVLSAGRCQTPALRLVYDNDMKISKGERKYKIEALFCPPRNIHFQLEKEMDTEEEVVAFMENTKTFAHYIKRGGSQEITRPPPIPLQTSRLLQLASNTLHLSPTTTMNMCQTLYQNGYITYMRTESSQYTPLFINQVVEYIKKTMGLSEKYIGDHSKITNIHSQNPHEAIRVTNITLLNIDTENKLLEKLYHLIWKHTLESCMSPSTSITTDYFIGSPIKNVNYIHTVEIPKSLGWKIVETTYKSNTSQTELKSGEQLYLNSLAQSSAPLSYKSINAHIVLHKHHSYYTEAGLIKALEDYGIGRPSTFSGLVETIIERGYVKKQDIEGEHITCNEYVWDNKKINVVQSTRILGSEKGKLVIQPLGKRTLEFLLKHFHTLFSYEYTKNMEKELDDTKDMNICKICYQDIKSMSKSLSTIMKEKVVFENGGDTYEFSYGKSGPVLKKNIGSLLSPLPDNNNETKKWEYVPLKKSIDIETLKSGNIEKTDFIETIEREIGNHMGSVVTIKRGKFGTYIEWMDTVENKEKREKIDCNKGIEDIKMEDIENLLVKTTTPIIEKNILRRLTPDMNIRRGKFGSYIYYKSPSMAAPKFVPLKKFKGNYMECEIGELEKWVIETLKS